MGVGKIDYVWGVWLFWVILCGIDEFVGWCVKSGRLICESGSYWLGWYVWCVGWRVGINWIILC